MTHDESRFFLTIFSTQSEKGLPSLPSTLVSYCILQLKLSPGWQPIIMIFTHCWRYKLPQSFGNKYPYYDWVNLNHNTLLPRGSKLQKFKLLVGYLGNTLHYCTQRLPSLCSLFLAITCFSSQSDSCQGFLLTVAALRAGYSCHLGLLDARATIILSPTFIVPHTSIPKCDPNIALVAHASASHLGELGMRYLTVSQQE